MISIVIPVFNDDLRIGILLNHLKKIRKLSSLEVIIVDGGNENLIMKNSWPWVKILNTDIGRAVQLNAGAKVAEGDILYFVHADALPPLSFPEDIAAAIKKGYSIGSFKFKLTPSSFLTNINSYLSRFNSRFSGGGDQTLFIQKEIFDKEGGFNETYCIMEDFELVHRLRPKYGFHIIQKAVEVSARKYQANSYWKVNMANYKAFKMYESGVKPELIKEAYYSCIKRGD